MPVIPVVFSSYNDFYNKREKRFDTGKNQYFNDFHNKRENQFDPDNNFSGLKRWFRMQPQCILYVKKPLLNCVKCTNTFKFSSPLGLSCAGKKCACFCFSPCKNNYLGVKVEGGKMILSVASSDKVIHRLEIVLLGTV